MAKSMVQLDDRMAGDRYRLLETMRDYGLERLAERGDLERMQRQHAAHYLEFAEDAAPRLVGADELERFDRVDGELANLRAALAFLRDSGDVAGYLRLAEALGRFWHIVGLYREGLAWLTSALAIGPAAPSRRRAETLALAANMAILLDRYDDAFALLDDSIACSTHCGEAPRPTALLALGLAALVQNRTEDARRYSEEAIAVARDDGDPYELADTLGFASGPISFSGDDLHAVELADEAVTIAQALGNDRLLAMAQQGAALARCRVDPAAAIELFTQSFAVLDHRFYRGSGTVHTWKAVAHTMLREYSAAADELCIALPLVQEAGEPYQHAIALAVTASVLSRPQPDLAVRLLALIERQRDDGRFLGASGDLAVQAHLRSRLESRLDPPHFAELWAQGRAMTLDAATADALDQLARITDPQ